MIGIAFKTLELTAVLYSVTLVTQILEDHVKLLVLTQCLITTCCLLAGGNKLNLLRDQRHIANVKSIDACLADVTTPAAKVTALRM